MRILDIKVVSQISQIFFSDQSINAAYHIILNNHILWHLFIEMSFRYRSNQGSSRQIQHTRIENGSDIEVLYAFGSLLGKGSFGTVTEAIRKTDETVWAVKVINKEKAGTSAVKLLEREVAIMKKKMFLVMELCALGGLEEHLLSKGCLPEKDILCIVQQLVDAVAYMHENDIIHRDLKLDNILLAKPENDATFNIKLTDFGLSYTRGGTGSDYMMNQMVGTPIYMAPEVITNYGYSQQCDIWSIGVILYKLLSGDSPFMADTEEELFELIRKGNINFESPVWSTVSQAAKQLVEAMLKVDPAHRLTSKEILCHPWIKGEQDVKGNVTTNVLEMMKQYNLEQKQIAEKQRKETNNNLTSDIELSNSSQARARSSLTPCKSLVKKALSSTSIALSPCHKESGKPSSATLSPRPSEKTGIIKSNSVPSYMQRTKSSKGSKSLNTKLSAKK
ncbi:serine/threonine-protein kinase 33-like isoform X2 [Hydractinia symbiolongicarpus]|uniref:serine/threonine-protein kinase 33-like isoform X2 n=1 Tax=Hydractinia symbiolongicarpus TaxID=13093 RepID=UPI00254DA09B|nr:serine/threonine-protein kinase 33-like isoform X2 [Hydractinia symbiolongicarpus]